MSNKFYELIHPGGPGGLFKEEGQDGKKLRMKRQKQDKEFKTYEGYMVVFFPKITGIGPAHIFNTDVHTLSNSPEAAKAKYMDRITKGEIWETYADAGWRIRKIRISDLGDAPNQLLTKEGKEEVKRCLEQIKKDREARKAKE